MASTTASMAASINTDNSTTSQPEQVGLSSGARIGSYHSASCNIDLSRDGILDSPQEKAPAVLNEAHISGVRLKCTRASRSEVPQELPEERGLGHFQYEMEGDSLQIAKLAAKRYSQSMLLDLNRNTPRKNKLLQ